MEKTTMGSAASKFALGFLSELRAPLILCLILTGCGIAGTRLSEIVKGDRAIPIEQSGTRVFRAQEKVAGSLPIGLEPGDEIRTDADSTAVIHFASGTKVYLQPNSHVRIGSVECIVCYLFASVKGVFRVETEFVTAGAEGTGYAVKSDQRGDLKVIVTEGRVKLNPRKGGKWTPVYLTAGQRADVSGTRPPKTRPATADELKSIQNWVEQVENATASGVSGRPHRPDRQDRPDRLDIPERRERIERPETPSDLGPSF